MSSDQALRQHLRALLTKAQAHVMLDDVLKDFPSQCINERPDGLPYSAFELLWHLRYAQRDILNFVSEAKYHAVNWPESYWPQRQDAAQADWDAEIEAFKADQAALLQLLDDPQTDLFAAVPNGESQTWLREFLVVADHNAYHIGQLEILKRLLGNGAQA